ncbi:alkaline phosphatase [Thermocladium modestius]|uniref:Alkaline phosphatase n=1 Tax=Thermocladium modestius TaxID=62609 RepID=A0A830GYC3_9CREN|nr:DedA family protein [Thermocladium modestius]GGP22356.1 alkaline phosphatase [Thermocladium modestius]
MNRKAMLGLSFLAVASALAVMDAVEMPFVDPLIDKIASIIAQYSIYPFYFVKLILFDGPIYVLTHTGYAGVFSLMVMESASLPVPSELVLPYAGYLAFLGYLGLTQTILVSTLASLVGSLIDYWLGLIAGRPIVLRLGRYIGIREDHLSKAEKWFDSRGRFAVLLARFVPGLRSIISIPAGIAEMNVWEFLIYTTIGSGAWNAGLVVMGYYLGQNWGLIYSFIKTDYTSIALIITAIGAIYMVLKIRSKDK